jgi:DNA invertase Pin-like site-specific DNA recombinase
MRCAIYTRKSSEEGLAQEFNSLDAQRESAEAYILSQRAAGWTVLPDRYDDGGYTGANLERPALRRLLTDVESGRIDCVVIYKVDRLSRSLLDFARLMGTFEEREISLVSVTQQFNTTASLGRLTLNILLSFAPFERDLIAERTRDKMSAARRKGKWVGGTPVLGYDLAPGGGRLVVNVEEAQQVRAAFLLCLEHRTLAPVLQHIQQQRWTTKRWTTRSGRVLGGRAFSGRDLLRLVNNVIYTGKVRSQGETYPGEHAAIIEEKDWQRVQRMLQYDGQSARLIQHRDERHEIEQATVQPQTSNERLPRITRLLALAVKFEALIQRGVIKDYAELARLGQISRARVTQIMNLLNLSPYIQEQILFWAQDPLDRHSIRETTVRALSSELSWIRQRKRWEEIIRVSRPDEHITSIR